jgi:hypothetical protein
LGEAATGSLPEEEPPPQAASRAHAANKPSNWGATVRGEVASVRKGWLEGLRFIE